MLIARALERPLRIPQRFRARDSTAPEVTVELDDEIRRSAVRHVPECAYDLIGASGNECGAQAEVTGHGRMLGADRATAVEHHKAGA